MSIASPGRSRRDRSVLLAILAISLSISSRVQAELYGIGRGLNVDTFYEINTATGAATPLFSFSNVGTDGTFGLAYNPVTDRYLTVQQTGTANSTLIEIDANTSTAAAVVHGIPGVAFEGFEYSAPLGGLVVSYGNTTAATGRLALLDNAYNLVNNNAGTGLPDGDTLFLDGAGGLNLLDPNNPYNGWQRNLITDPFGSISITPNGLQNPFAAADTDAAWKADEAQLFLTRTTALWRIVGPNNLFSVGSYGGGASITGIAVGPPIPEPAALGVVGLVIALGLRQRSSAGGAGAPSPQAAPRRRPAPGW